MKNNQQQNTNKEKIGELAVKIDKEFILRNISLILSIVLIVSLFTTFCVVNSSELGYDNDLALTGFEVLLGTEFTDGTYISGGFFGFIMVLAPIFLIACNYIKQLAKIKKLMYFIVPIAGLIAAFFAERSIASNLSVSASTSIGYYLYWILSIAMIVVGFLQYKNIPLNKDGVMEYVNKETKLHQQPKSNSSVSVPPPIKEKMDIQIDPNIEKSYSPQLVGITGEFAGMIMPIPKNGLNLGREGNNCQVVFAESTPGISRNHCQVTFNQQSKMFVLKDMGSSNGTFLMSGQRLSPSGPIAFKSGEQFYLGSQTNMFEVR